MVNLRDAHQQFVGHLRGKARASATILAYGKDIDQLVSFLEKGGKINPVEITTEELQAFMDSLVSENYTPKSISICRCTNYST